MQKKYQIFVSSTYKDLVEERNEVIATCLRMGHIPVGMEMFNAGNHEQWKVIKRTIDFCDYYCVIVAKRYGSRGKDGISYTEMEYDYAVSKDIPVLGFPIAEKANWPVDRIDDKQADIRSLKAFRIKVQKRMARFWEEKNQLARDFAVSLAEMINLEPRPGWIRADNQGYETALAEIARLSVETDNLRNELETAKRHTNENEEIARLFADLCATSLQEELPVISRDAPEKLELTIFATDVASVFKITADIVALDDGIETSTFGFMQYVFNTTGRIVKYSGCMIVNNAFRRLAARGVFRTEIGERERLYYLTERGVRLLDHVICKGYLPSIEWREITRIVNAPTQGV